MIIRLLVLLLALSLTLALIGKTLRHKSVYDRRSETSILRDAEIGRESYPGDRRNRGRSKQEIRLPVDNGIKYSRNNLGNSFISKMKGFSSDRDLALFLKSTAQKRIALTQADKQHIVDELMQRVPNMSVHSASDVLWSLGTLKIPLRQMVRYVGTPLGSYVSSLSST